MMGNQWIPRVVQVLERRRNCCPNIFCQKALLLRNAIQLTNSNTDFNAVMLVSSRKLQFTRPYLVSSSEEVPLPLTIVKIAKNQNDSSNRWFVIGLLQFSELLGVSKLHQLLLDSAPLCYSLPMCSHNTLPHITAVSILNSLQAFWGYDYEFYTALSTCSGYRIYSLLLGCIGIASFKPINFSVIIAPSLTTVCYAMLNCIYDYDYLP